MSDLDSAGTAVVISGRKVLLEVLDELGPRLVAHSGNVEVDTKSDGTPVTAIDHEVDERLVAALASAFPGHGIVSEERDTVAPDTDWTWIIDPIDGTSNFVAGLPYWCVSVALAFRGTPVLGIVDAPALGRRYVGVRGDGAKRNGAALTVRAPVDWRAEGSGHLPVMLTTGTARRARQAGLRLNPRVMGSSALDLAVVAEGVAVASVAVNPHVWDVAAGQVLVEEAGGALVMLRGMPLLPLRTGTDYEAIATTTASAGDADYARRIAEALLPAP